MRPPEREKPMCPLAQSDGHDAPRLIDELVPVRLGISRRFPVAAVASSYSMFEPRATPTRSVRRDANGVWKGLLRRERRFVNGHIGTPWSGPRRAPGLLWWTRVWVLLNVTCSLRENRWPHRPLPDHRELFRRFPAERSLSNQIRTKPTRNPPRAPPLASRKRGVSGLIIPPYHGRGGCLVS